MVFRGAEADSDWGIAIADLSGGGFRFLTSPIDNVFARDDPAVSPDGKLVVYTDGNENPQLSMAYIGGGTTPFYYPSHSDYPTRPDWQPRP